MRDKLIDLVVDVLKENKKIVILGTKGTGKSELVSDILTEVAEDSRILYIDKPKELSYRPNMKTVVVDTTKDLTKLSEKPAILVIDELKEEEEYRLFLDWDSGSGLSTICVNNLEQIPSIVGSNKKADYYIKLDSTNDFKIASIQKIEGDELVGVKL